MRYILKLMLTTGALYLSLAVPLLGQQEQEEGPTMRFNGLGRASILQTGLDGPLTDTDSTTVPNLSDGEFLLDLAINATPNDKTEVQGILRLRNEFGGFFGSGVSIEVRELWARGIIADVLRYRVGDMDLVMTPYTFYNFEEEGQVNEAAVFQPQREIIDYELFYTDDNRRRMQGAKLDFGLTFASLLDRVDVSGFITRVRGTNFQTVPNRFVAGGNVDLSTLAFGEKGTKGQLGLNLIHTFDDLQSGNATSGIRNTIYTLDFDLALLDGDNLGVHLRGEAGRSSLEFKRDTASVFDEGDTFLEVGAALELKEQDLSISATFVDVGPDFFSTGAQSKRVAFDRNKTFYHRIGNEREIRVPTLFDLNRDRALYTYQLSDRLMAYDPRYANTQPYGPATPNRRGLRLGVEYGVPESAIEGSVDASFLQEIRGQGTTELKDFLLIRAMANLNVHRLADWRKTLRVTLGFQSEQTDRGGVELEQIDLSSSLLEVGLEAELFSRFDLLAGGKFFTASGNEYIPLIEEFNDVGDFPGPYIVDDEETLLAAGFRYRFKEGIYLTTQYQTFSFSRAVEGGNDYRIDQFFVLYNMDF